MDCRLPSLKDDFVPRYSASHYNAALYVQAAVRGFPARQELKDRKHPFEVDDNDNNNSHNEKMYDSGAVKTEKGGESLEVKAVEVE